MVFPRCRAAMERERDGFCEHWPITGDAEAAAPANGRAAQFQTQQNDGNANGAENSRGC